MPLARTTADSRWDTASSPTVPWSENTMALRVRRPRLQGPHWRHSARTKTDPAMIRCVALHLATHCSLSRGSLPDEASIGLSFMTPAPASSGPARCAQATLRMRARLTSPRFQSRRRLWRGKSFGVTPPPTTSMTRMLRPPAEDVSSAPRHGRYPALRPLFGPTRQRDRTRIEGG